MSSGGGGGGNSGVVRYAPYLEWNHKKLLDNYVTHPAGDPYTDVESISLLEAVNDASSFSSGTPYDGVFAYGPDTDLANMQDRLDTWTTLLDAVDVETLFGSYSGTAKTAFSTDIDLDSETDIATIDPETLYTDYTTLAESRYDTLIDEDLSEQIDTLVETFESKVRAEAMNDLSRVNAGALDIGAVPGTQFHAHMARFSERIRQRVDEFRAQLTIELKKDSRQMKAQFVQGGAAAMAQMLATKIQAMQNNETKELQYVLSGLSQMQQYHLGQLQGQGTSVVNQLDVSRATIMAKQDESQLDVRYRQAEQLWDLTLFQYPANFISAISGSALVPNKEDEKSMLSQFGGATAAGVGTAAALYGSGIGAPAGAALTIAMMAGSLFG